jgi:hypothetical protein
LPVVYKTYDLLRAFRFETEEPRHPKPAVQIAINDFVTREGYDPQKFMDQQIQNERKYLASEKFKQHQKKLQMILTSNGIEVTE